MLNANRHMPSQFPGDKVPIRYNVSPYGPLLEPDMRSSFEIAKFGKFGHCNIGKNENIF